MTVVQPLPRRPEEQVECMRCWCGDKAQYTLALTNARIGTGQFPRCHTHALKDLETSDFEILETWS